MPEAEIDIEKVFKNMMFGKNMTGCDYFPERQAENILTYFDSLNKEKLDCIVYERLLRQGFCTFKKPAANPS